MARIYTLYFRVLFTNYALFCLNVITHTHTHDSSTDGSSLIVGNLLKITLYPVKSCAGFSVDSWPLSSKGLLYDREWMVLSQHNSVLSQKQEAKLCLVQPSVNLEGNVMILTAKGCGSVQLPLERECQSVQHILRGNAIMGQVSSSSLVRVCGDRCV